MSRPIRRALISVSDKTGLAGFAIDAATGVLTGGCDPRRDGYVVPA